MKLAIEIRNLNCMYTKEMENTMLASYLDAKV